MTAAPEPTTYLALVVCHLSLDMVVAPRRDGPIPDSHVTCGPAHHLAHSGLHQTTGILTLCTKNEEKSSAQHSIFLTNAMLEMHNDDHDADRQYEGRRNSRTPGLRYSGYRHRCKKRKLIHYPLLTGMPSTWTAAMYQQEARSILMHKS